MAPPLNVQAVKTFCSQREVDLVIVPTPLERALRWRAEFDGYGEFFTIDAESVEYVQWPNGITVGAIEVAPDVRDAAGLADAVRLLVGEVSGATLVVRSADSSSFQGANAGELGIVVANRISFKKGKDWKEYGPGAPGHLG